MQRQQMDAQAQQQQQIDTYIRKMLSALENDPDSLSSTERQFGAKYAAVVQRVRQIESDLNQIKEQVRQGEARAKSLELQHQSESGRAAGLLEALVSLKFEAAPEVKKPPPPIESPLEKEVGGDNGTPKPIDRVEEPPVAQV